MSAFGAERNWLLGRERSKQGNSVVDADAAAAEVLRRRGMRAKSNMSRRTIGLSTKEMIWQGSLWNDDDESHDAHCRRG
jgi:hypothetical protein